MFTGISYWYSSYLTYKLYLRSNLKEKQHGLCRCKTHVAPLLFAVICMSSLNVHNVYTCTYYKCLWSFALLLQDVT